MRTINLIPENYEGNWREALGYAWAKLVTGDNGRADQERSIPGEDLHMKMEACLDMLEAEHGPVLIVRTDCMIWDRGETRDGRTMRVNRADQLATINGMWCGGPTVAIYRVADCERPECTVLNEDLFIKVKPSAGWCAKCQSWCFGDCEASASL